MPSALSVVVDGITLTLCSERDASDELMSVVLPRLQISRTPRVGDPVPPLQRAEISFDGNIAVSTPIPKKVALRVLQAQHMGAGGYSRMGGRLRSCDGLERATPCRTDLSHAAAAEWRSGSGVQPRR
jgi:hypothetical protein